MSRYEGGSVSQHSMPEYQKYLEREMKQFKKLKFFNVKTNKNKQETGEENIEKLFAKLNFSEIGCSSMPRESRDPMVLSKEKKVRTHQ